MIHLTAAMLALADFTEPLWVEIWRACFTQTIMAGSLVAWVLSGRRWNAYAYWVVVALGLIRYAYLLHAGGWDEVVPGRPESEGNLLFWAKIAYILIVAISLSAPFWRRRARRCLGLQDGHETAVTI
jgi:hypothetical protein